MFQLTVSDRAQLAGLAVGRARRDIVARVLGSRLLRWRYGVPTTEEVLIVPQDLRTTDSSFVDELAIGQFCLAGRVASHVSGSPFDVVPPSESWARELHGFAWLRHLRAVGTSNAIDIAQNLVSDWLSRARGRKSGTAWEPAVVGRRIISWLANATLLLDSVDQPTFDRTTDSLSSELLDLATTWRQSPDGYPRLVPLIALCYGKLCLAGHERDMGWVEGLLSTELDRQILPDGGHVSRHAGVLVELLLDLLPLRQCFLARQRPIPLALEQAIGRMLPMLRHMRLGDGSLARFNGVGVSSLATLAIVQAYETDAPAAPETADSGYLRLQYGPMTLICDVGGPPPIPLAGTACAGCLSFELSIGDIPVFVNGGAPAPWEWERRAASRSTACHNTLCLSNTSSSRLLENPWLEQHAHGLPIRFPARVVASRERKADSDVVDAWHDGYEKAFGLIHRRRIEMDAAGCWLAGCDRLGPRSGALRLVQDIPYAIHFHMHPKLTCVGDVNGAVMVVLPTGDRWWFSAMGAHISIEPSIHFADLVGSASAVQIVLRGASYGESEVNWRLQRHAA